MFRLLKSFIFLVSLSFAIIFQVHATGTGLDAQSGQLEYTCYNKSSGGTFKRPPIIIKFTGKRFTGEVKFYS